MSFYLQCALALVLLVAGGTGGWQARGWKADHDRRVELEQMNRDMVRRTEHAGEAAIALADKQTSNTVRRRAADREIANVVTRTVYATACLDADGMRLLADEIGRNPHAGEPRAAVPAVAGASGP